MLNQELSNGGLKLLFGYHTPHFIKNHTLNTHRVGFESEEEVANFVKLDSIQVEKNLTQDGKNSPAIYFIGVCYFPIDGFNEDFMDINFMMSEEQVIIVQTRDYVHATTLL